MPKKIGELEQTVHLDQGFPGTYKWIGGSSYYLDGDTSKGIVHFTIVGNNNENFEKFHISYTIPDTGFNTQVYYVVKNNVWEFNGIKEEIPQQYISQWHSFLQANREKYDLAAKDFSGKV